MYNLWSLSIDNSDYRDWTHYWKVTLYTFSFSVHIHCLSSVSAVHKVSTICSIQSDSVFTMETKVHNLKYRNHSQLLSQYMLCCWCCEDSMPFPHSHYCIHMYTHAENTSNDDCIHKRAGFKKNFFYKVNRLCRSQTACSRKILKSEWFLRPSRLFLNTKAALKTINDNDSWEGDRS